MMRYVVRHRSLCSRTCVSRHIMDNDIYEALTSAQALVRLHKSEKIHVHVV